MRTKTCASCGASFVPGSNRARYCSPECRRAVRRSRTPRTEPEAVVGSRREGFRFVITDPETGRTVEGRWRPAYLREDRERLGYLDRASGDLEHLAGLATFEGSRHRGGIRAVSLRDDPVRRWVIEHHGEDLGAGL